MENLRKNVILTDEQFVIVRMFRNLMRNRKIPIEKNAFIRDLYGELDDAAALGRIAGVFVKESGESIQFVRHMAINAVAGSGKTFIVTKLIREALKTRFGKRSAKVAAFVFNRNAAKNINDILTAENLPACAWTLHSSGFRLIREYLGPDVVNSISDKGLQEKYMYLLRDTLAPSGYSGWDDDDKQSQRTYRKIKYASRILHRVLALLVDECLEPTWENYEYILSHHGIDVSKCFGENGLDTDPVVAIKKALELGEEMAKPDPSRKRGRKLAVRIAYIDMVRLPRLWDLRNNTYDVVFIDEAQDLNKLQHDMIDRFVADGGHVMFVGDPRQSIQGWAGADSNSMGKLWERYPAAVFTLSTCFRCPTKVLDLARNYVPYIKPRDDAPEGIVEYITVDDISAINTKNALILARRTADVVDVARSILRSGKRVVVRGKAFGQATAASIKKISYQSDAIGTFRSNLDAWYDRQMSSPKIKNNESKRLSVDDFVETVKILIDISNSRTVKDLLKFIYNFFDDRKYAPIVCSTVHRAKGDGEDDVFLIVRDGEIMLTFPEQLPWQRRQEKNLAYVALTRAKKRLFICNKNGSADNGDDTGECSPCAPFPIVSLGESPPPSDTESVDPSEKFVDISERPAISPENSLVDVGDEYHYKGPQKWPYPKGYRPKKKEIPGREIYKTNFARWVVKVKELGSGEFWAKGHWNNGVDGCASCGRRTKKLYHVFFVPRGDKNQAKTGKVAFGPYLGGNCWHNAVVALKIRKENISRD